MHTTRSQPPAPPAPPHKHPFIKHTQSFQCVLIFQLFKSELFLPTGTVGNEGPDPVSPDGRYRFIVATNTNLAEGYKPQARRYRLRLTQESLKLTIRCKLSLIWVRSRNCGCLVTWFCYQLIAKPGNKTAAVLWPDPYPWNMHTALLCFIRSEVSVRYLRFNMIHLLIYFRVTSLASGTGTIGVITEMSHERHGVPDHWPFECLLNTLFGPTSKQHGSSALLALC